MKTIIKDFKNKLIPVNIKFSTHVEFNSDNYRTGTVIKELIYDSVSDNLIGEFSINHSLHSYKRAKCRGFSTEDIMSVIEFGELIFKQGLCFYIALKRHLPEFVDSKTIDRINNMVVVTNNLGNALVTCYKSKNASTHLRKKSKELKKYLNCA